MHIQFCVLSGSRCTDQGDSKRQPDVSCRGEALPALAGNNANSKSSEALVNCMPCTGSLKSALETVAENPCWYVAYTYPRHERAVADQLERKSVEAFLPTFTETSQWKDRRVKLELPLFPGYVFARITASERVKILSVPSVIRMLHYQGALAPVSEDEIDTIRQFLTQGAKLRPHRYLAVGDLVRVREGVFTGVQGIVVRENNGCRLVVSIGLIQQSVAMEVDAHSLEYVGPSSGSIQRRPSAQAFADASVRVYGSCRDAGLARRQPES